jgi:colicin import membrane protein
MTWPVPIKGGYAGGISLQAMILFSLVFHALVLSLVLLPSRFPTPRWTFGPVYSVQLVGILPGSASSPVRGSSSLERELLESVSKAPAIIPHKKTEPSTFAPISRIEVRKRTDGNVERMMEAFKRRTDTVKSTPAPKTPQVGAEQGQASSGRQTDSELAVRMEAYYARIWSRIKGQWALPSGMIPRQDLEAILQTRISKQGTVSGVSFEKRSGNRYFDESALKAIRKASPFPPLPETLREGSIEIGIRFHSRELR